MTGMEIFDRSLPIFLHSRFQRLRPAVSALTAGNFWRRPVILDKVLEVAPVGSVRDGWVFSRDSNSVDKELGGGASS